MVFQTNSNKQEHYHDFTDILGKFDNKSKGIYCNWVYSDSLTFFTRPKLYIKGYIKDQIL